VPASNLFAVLGALVSLAPYGLIRVFDSGTRRVAARMDRMRLGRPWGLSVAALSLWRLMHNAFAVVATLVLVTVLVALCLLALPAAMLQRLRGPGHQVGRKVPWVTIVAGFVISALTVAAVPGDLEARHVLAGVPVLAAVLCAAAAPRIGAVIGTYLGDIDAVLRQPAVERRMVQRVASALVRLEGAVAGAPVVVLAHSQGAEIARRVLIERSRPIRGLVTFGSGIAKLDAVARVSERPLRFALVIVLRGGSAICFVLAVATAYSWDESASEVLRASVAIVFAGVLMTVSRTALRHVMLDERSYGPTMTPANVERWVDFYTANDSVTEGALPVAATWGVSREVVNARIPLVDHVLYWQNVVGFRALVLLELAEMAGRERDERLWQAAYAGAARHARAVAVRVRVRWAVAGLGVLAQFLPGLDAITRIGLVTGAIAALVTAEWRLVIRERRRLSGGPRDGSDP
jgi:hypothetical protein